MSNISIIPYEKPYENLWDDFIWKESANGTIFHTRRFLRYHEENRFKDCSALFLEKGKVIGVFPACIENDVIYSHRGSSSGGPVVHKKFFKYSLLRGLIDSLENYYKGVKMSIKIPESIFFESNNDVLLYIFKQLAFTVYYELGSFKSLEGNILETISKATNRNIIKRLMREQFTFEVATTREDYEAYHAILCKNLSKHRAKPTHTLPEFLRLSELIDENQLLVVARDVDSSILGGVWMIKASRLCWHTQYIAKNYDFSVNGIIEALLYKCFEIAKSHRIGFVNLGISTENNGLCVNESLLSFKEGLGTTHINRYLLESK